MEGKMSRGNIRGWDAGRGCGEYQVHCETLCKKMRGNKTSTHPRLTIRMNIHQRDRAHIVRCKCEGHSPTFSIFE